MDSCRLSQVAAGLTAGTRKSHSRTLPYLTEKFLNPGGVLGSPIENERYLRRSPQMQSLRDLVAHVTHRRGEAGQALGARLLVTQHGYEHPDVVPVRAQFDAGYGHETDPRVFELSFDNPGDFAADLIGQTIVPMCGCTHKGLSDSVIERLSE